MISGLSITTKFKARDSERDEIPYSLDTRDTLEGPLRSMQKFVVILMTSKGSDPIRPWFGTEIPNLTNINITTKQEITIFSREQCNDAISQFFRLQAEENLQNNQTGYDVIKSIELTKIEISNDHHITLVFKFTPLKYESIIFSIDFKK